MGFQGVDIVILRRFQVTAVVVAPIWAGASFFAKLWPDGRHAAKFVRKMLMIRPFFVCGPLVKSLGMRGRKPYFTAVLKVDFSTPYSWQSSTCKQLCLSGGCEVCEHLA